MATTLTPSITVTEEINIHFTPEKKELLKWNNRLPKKNRNRFSGPGKSMKTYYVSYMS